MKATWLAGLAAAAAWVVAPAVIAQEAGSATTQAQAELDRAEAERQLADAQRRLEEAAREVAELSATVHGPVIEEVRRIRIGGPGPGRAVLGVNIDDAGTGGGVRVMSVSPGGPAAEAGVRAGDRIVVINGRQVDTGRDLIANMRTVEPGEKVNLELQRDGRPVKVTVVAKRSEEMMFMAGPGHMEHGMPPMPHFLVGPFGDAEFVEMTPALGRYFGTDKGLLVVQAPRAAGADLEEGDVILAIGGREPQNAGHAMRILGSYQPGETVEIRVLRQRKERTVRMTVPEAPAADLRMRRIAPPAPPDAPVPPAR